MADLQLPRAVGGQPTAVGGWLPLSLADLQWGSAISVVFQRLGQSRIAMRIFFGEWCAVRALRSFHTIPYQRGILCGTVGFIVV